MVNRRRLVLHIGQGKTGSSSIQGFMATNREVLAANGVLYPRITDHDRHFALSLYPRSDEEAMQAPVWWRSPWSTPAELRSHLETELIRQIESTACETVVLSDEGLFQHDADRIGVLVDALAPVTEELVLVAYLRRQDEHVVSAYKQAVRAGASWLLADFVRRPATVDVRQYHRQLTALAGRFPSADLIVRPYHRSRFRQHGVVEDFLTAIGADGVRDQLVGSDSGAVANRSMDAYTTEYLRRLNATSGGRADKKTTRRVTKLSDGPDLRLGDDDVVRLWQQWQPGNERLVQEFLPDAGDIFLEPPSPKPGAITQDEVTAADLERVDARLADLTGRANG